MRLPKLSTRLCKRVSADQTVSTCSSLSLLRVLQTKRRLHLRAFTGHKMRLLVLLLIILLAASGTVDGQSSNFRSDCPTSGLPPCVDNWSGIILPAGSPCGAAEYCVPVNPTPSPFPNPNSPTPPPSPGMSPNPDSPSPNPSNDTSPSPDPGEESPEPSPSPEPSQSPEPGPPSRQRVKDVLDALKPARGHKTERKRKRPIQPRDDSAVHKNKTDQSGGPDKQPGQQPGKKRQAAGPDNTLSDLLVTGGGAGRRLQQQWQQQQRWMQQQWQQQQQQHRQLAALNGRRLLAVQQSGSVCHYKLKRAGFFCYNPSKCSIASLYNTCDGTSIECQTAMIPGCLETP